MNRRLLSVLLTLLILVSMVLAACGTTEECPECPECPDAGECPDCPEASAPSALTHPLPVIRRIWRSSRRAARSSAAPAPTCSALATWTRPATTSALISTFAGPWPPPSLTTPTPSSSCR